MAGRSLFRLSWFWETCSPETSPRFFGLSNSLSDASFLGGANFWSDFKLSMFVAGMTTCLWYWVRSASGRDQSNPWWWYGCQKRNLEYFHLGVDPEGNVSLEELIQTFCHSASHRDIRVSHRGMRVFQRGTGVHHRWMGVCQRGMQREGEEKKDKKKLSVEQLVLRWNHHQTTKS